MGVHTRAVNVRKAQLSFSTREHGFVNLRLSNFAFETLGPGFYSAATPLTFHARMAGNPASSPKMQYADVSNAK